MRLSLRLFLACTGLAAASLIGFVLWQQHAFSRGFSGYLQALALERAEFVAAGLATHYRSDRGWQRLRADPQQFGRWVDPFAPPPRTGASPEPPPGPPQAHGSASAGAPQHAPRPSAARAGPPPGGSRGMDPGFQLALFDSEGVYVAGRRSDAAAVHSLAVRVDGAQVGELRLYAGPRAPQGLEADFARQQQRSAGWIGLALLAAATCVSLWLSRRLLKPIRALATGTHALAAGDYAQRVPVQGRDELAQLAQDFNVLAQTLQRAREARRAFGADLAHELRTPLTILRGELQILLAGARPLDRSALESLLAETEQLGALTEDLYQLALSDAGALAYRFEPLELDELLRDEHAQWAPRLAHAGLTLELELAGASLWIEADTARLQQLLRNLLSNAQRYTDAPGRVRLSAERAADQIVLRIEDSAPGVPEADLPRVFERLFRGERCRQRVAGGSGLGLSIVQAVAQAHRAEVGARAADLGGLCVEIRFPASDAA